MILFNVFGEIIKDPIERRYKSSNLSHTEKSKVFKNKEFHLLMRKYNIKLYHTDNEENNWNYRKIELNTEQQIENTFWNK